MLFFIIYIFLRYISMRVINADIGSTENFILRELGRTINYSVFVVNEDNKSDELILEYAINNSGIIANDMQLSVVFADRTYINNQSYSIKIVNDGVILHRNRVFFTTQNPQNYSVNG